MMHYTTIGFFNEKRLISSFIQYVFSQSPRMKIYFNAGNESALFEALAKTTPDVLLVNLTGKLNSGNTLIKKIKNSFPSIRIAGFIYGIELSQQEVFRIINAGASALFTDAHSPADVLEGVEELVEKGFHLNNVVNDAMFTYCKRSSTLRKSFGPEEKFCEREIRIIEGKRGGKTSRQIADELFLSKKTVDGVLQDMYNRFECKNFYELLGKYDCLRSA